MQIHFLKNFLSHVSKDVVKEMEEIEKKAERGELTEVDDYERAFDYPLFRQDFGSRAVCYELNALIEEQLHLVAEPIFADKKSKGKFKKQKNVHQLNMKIVMKLIEDVYGPIKDQIPCWDSFVELRKAVNSFKHNQGQRKAEDIEINQDGFYETHWKVNFEQSARYVEDMLEVSLCLQKLSA
jgi:hypothetical protein